MSRRPGRPSRQYSIRVRTERRDPIDYAALAQAALEQAAMDQQRHEDTSVIPPRVPRGTRGPDRVDLLDDDAGDDEDAEEGAPW